MLCSPDIIFIVLIFQRMRRKTAELVSLRAALAESESKEEQLKSNVAALGTRVSNLDKQLRCDTYSDGRPHRNPITVRFRLAGLPLEIVVSSSKRCSV